MIVNCDESFTVGQVGADLFGVVELHAAEFPDGQVGGGFGAVDNGPSENEEHDHRF